MWRRSGHKTVRMETVGRGPRGKIRLAETATKLLGIADLFQAYEVDSLTGEVRQLDHKIV